MYIYEHGLMHFILMLISSHMLQPPFYSQNVNVMYEKILQAELKFPPYLSAEARSLLLGVRSVYIIIFIVFVKYWVK